MCDKKVISGSAEGKLGKTTCLTIKLLLVRVGIDSSSSSRGVNTDASTSVSSSAKVFTISVTPNSFLLPESHGSMAHPHKAEQAHVSLLL